MRVLPIKSAKSLLVPLIDEYMHNTRYSVGDDAAKASSTSARFVTELNQNDVLMGRGSAFIGYEGNQRLRQLVWDRRDEYLACTRRKEKHRISLEIIETVHSRGGRFLQRITSLEEATKLGVPPRAQAWRVVPSSNALYLKVKQLMRDVGLSADHKRGMGKSSAANAANAAAATTTTMDKSLGDEEHESSEEEHDKDERKPRARSAQPESSASATTASGNTDRKSIQMGAKKPQTGSLADSEGTTKLLEKSSLDARPSHATASAAAAARHHLPQRSTQERSAMVSGASSVPASISLQIQPPASSNPMQADLARQVLTLYQLQQSQPPTPSQVQLLQLQQQPLLLQRLGNNTLVDLSCATAAARNDRIGYPSTLLSLPALPLNRDPATAPFSANSSALQQQQQRILESLLAQRQQEQDEQQQVSRLLHLARTAQDQLSESERQVLFWLLNRH